MNRRLVASQADQDRLWSEFDDWYASCDKECMLAFVKHLDSDEETDQELLHDLDQDACSVVVRLTLHTLRELALRNMRAEEEE